MFESMSNKGPKLVYSHSRQTVPERKLNAKTSSTPISVSSATSTFLQSRAIPRPSVTVVAQTRKSSIDEQSPQPSSRDGVVSSSSGDSSVLTPISQSSTLNGMVLVDQKDLIESNSYYQGSEPDQAEVYENYRHIPLEADGVSYRSDHEQTSIAATENPIPIEIERVSSLDNNNNTDSTRTDYDTLPYSANTDSLNGNGFHGGYRVYQGKLYEITREIPIILADSNLSTRQSMSLNMNKALTSNSMPTHSSTATASIVKTGSVSNGQTSNTNMPLTDITLQQPRALPAPKLNGKAPNGVLQPSAQAPFDLDSQTRYDQLQPHQQHQSLFRGHRRQQDDIRFVDGPERLTYTSGAQSMRRPNTVGVKKVIRDLSPQTWAARGWAGPVTSPMTVGSASRRTSSQHSAGGARTLPFRSNGGQIWTVITKSPPHSPRQRRSSSTGQQVVTRASYRLDPNISAKLQSSSPASSQPTKSILKSSCTQPSAMASGISSGKTEQYDNHPFPSDRSRSTSPAYLLPRPRASLAYRDFDFSSLPSQQTNVSLAKSPKQSLQQANSLPLQHHRGKSPALHNSTSRRPATAGAALQKNAEATSKGLQPQKKSVTFNSQVRLHVDNNVSTIRSLSIDS
ncbi:hypothetical protein ElyMa_001450300 [Elysia marginata]|uniref:Wiskott-Aldrich syndrome protein family member n=1 Tax=Elysia marginata TaxID=1093978 RepID=A0AAV4J0Q2_9GAST|nr:hypothetical protein ElyMa_001450300 [Elysia marginata]